VSDHNEALRALEQDREVFLSYVDRHLAKGTEEGKKKAFANQKHVERLTEVIARLAQAPHMPVSREAWPTVSAFAAMMRQKLEQNRHKGGWEVGEHDDLRWQQGAYLDRLIEEAEELKKALFKADYSQNPQEIAEEAADVANFAMMIADISGGLPQLSTPQPDKIAGQSGKAGVDRESAWVELRSELEGTQPLGSWSVGDAATYKGFFNWGWDKAFVTLRGQK